MYKYQDNYGSITIDWNKGCVCSLKRCEITLTSAEKLPLFSLMFRRDDGSSVERDSFQGALSALKECSDSAEAVYDFDGFEVKVSVRFGGESWSAWRMRIANHTDAAVEWVDFPQIPLVREHDGHKASFYWPYNEGVQVDDIDLREASGWGHCDTEFPGMGKYALFPGMVESQFVAYELNSGLYLGAHDKKRGLKNIDFMPLEDCVRLKMRIYAGGAEAQLLINWTKNTIACTCGERSVTVPAMGGVLVKD